MNKIAVQTSNYIFEDNLDENYKNLAEAGFGGVDLNLDNKLTPRMIENCEKNDFFQQSIEEICEDYKKHKEAAEKYGVEFSQMHAPFPLYIINNDDYNDYLIMAVEKCIALCDYLKCKYIIVHPVNVMYKLGYEEEQKINLEFYRRLIPQAKKYGVVICLENMFSVINGHVYEAVCSDIKDAVYYIDKLNEEAGKELFGFCFDVGHSTLLGKPMYQSIITLGHRLKALHIHDNDGIYDNHQFPYTYCRNWGSAPVTDWDGFLKGLRDINYKGVLDFETFNGIAAYPKPLFKSALKLLGDIGKYMSDEINK